MTRTAITHLKLSHFRSHKTFERDFDTGAIALVGPNGAGKTNILEAISLLSPGRGLRRARGADLMARPEMIGWRLRAELTYEGQFHEVESGSETGEPRHVRIDGKLAPQIALGRIAPMVWLVPAMDRLWTESAEGRRRFLDRMTLSFRPEHAKSVLEYEKSMRERNRLLKEGVRDGHWYRALETQMGVSAHQITLNRRHCVSELMAAQSDVQTSFPCAQLTLATSDEAPDLVDASARTSFLSETRSRDLAAGRTLHGPHRHDLEAYFPQKQMPASACSTGEQKALLLSLVLANARSLKKHMGAAPILLLDEVSAHLDRGRRAALYQEIEKLQVQAWMTGTELALFEDMSQSSQIIELTGT